MKLKKDALVLWRSKPRLISLLLFPIMITLFGYGMGGSLENIPVAVVDQSSGNITDMTLGSIKGMSLFDVKISQRMLILPKQWFNVVR